MPTEIDLGIDHLTDVTIIGQGGFSVVYAVSHTLFKRRMAVKLLNPMTKESERLRFERECEVLGRLSGHPNVVSVFNAGYTATDRPYLLMELVEGGTLQDRLEVKGALPWREAVAGCLPICEALAAAHAESILHRDVKPENILLADDGNPRLADFGIASLRDATGNTSTHITASMLHTAPETFENLRDERSDLYSLASTLYGVIVGGAPFWRTTDQSIHPLMNRLLNEPAPPIPPHHAPPELDAFVRRALAKDPNQRPQTAAQFSAELGAVLRSQGTTPPQPLAQAPPKPAAPSSWAPAPANWDSGSVDSPAPQAGTEAVAPGWYPGPGDPVGTNRYWDGYRWQGQAEQIGQQGHETVAGGRRLAGPERRILGRLIDFVLWFAFWVVWLIAVVPTEDNTPASYLHLLALGLWTTASIAAYEIGMVTAFGATLGKLTLAMKVVNEDGSRVGFSTAAMRMVLFIVLSVVSTVAYVPLLVMFVVAIAGLVALYSNDRRQTPWDKQAKTLIVER